MYGLWVMSYINEKHIDGSDRAIKALIKAHNKAARPKEAKKTKKGIDSFKTHAQHKPLFRGGRVHVDDIIQGGIGNCYLLTALLSIAERNPEYIESMITQRPDGGIVVRLFDKKTTEDNQTITTPVYYHIDNTAVKVDRGGSHKAGWVDAIVKAYYLHRLRHNDKRTKYKKGSEYVLEGSWNYNDVLSAGHSSTAYEHLTGVRSTLDKLKKPSHPLDRLLLDESLITLYKLDHPDLPGFSKQQKENIINNFYFVENGQQLQLWKQLLGDELAIKLRNQFPVDKYQELASLFDAIKKQDKTSAIRHIQSLWKDLSDEEVQQIYNGFSQANTEYKEAPTAWLIKGFQQGNYFCAGSKQDQTAPGLVSQHAYHILNIYKRDDQYVVLLENPWGRKVPSIRFHPGTISNPAIPLEKGDPRDCYRARGGIFELPLDQFYENFESVYQTKLEAHLEHIQNQEEAARLDKALAEERHAKFVNRVVYNLSSDSIARAINSLQGNPKRSEPEDALLQDLLTAKKTKESKKYNDTVDHDRGNQNQSEKQTQRSLRDSGLGDCEDAMPKEEDLLELAGASSYVKVFRTNAHRQLTAQRERTHHLRRVPGTPSPAHEVGDDTSDAESTAAVTGHNVVATITRPAFLNASRTNNSNQVILDETKSRLDQYLSHADRSKNKSVRYRLFYRGSDRTINRTHRIRAKTLLAFINTWNETDSAAERTTLEAMMLSLQSYHAETRSLSTYFHSNRLGNILNGLNTMTHDHSRLIELSHATNVKLQQRLREQNLSPEVKKNIFYANLPLERQPTSDLADEETIRPHLSMS